MGVVSVVLMTQDGNGNHAFARVLRAYNHRHSISSGIIFAFVDRGHHGNSEGFNQQDGTDRVCRERRGETGPNTCYNKATLNLLSEGCRRGGDFFGFDFLISLCGVDLSIACESKMILST